MQYFHLLCSNRKCTKNVRYSRYIVNSIFKKAFAVLSNGEQKRFLLLVFTNVLISALDILSLGLLVFFIGFYTHSANIAPGAFPAWISNSNPVLFIGVFLVIYSLKSIVAYLAYQAQFNFVYGVASRISEFNLQRYLDGCYKDYINTDSSVYIRRISQQPIEFSHYVLGGMLAISTEGIMAVMAIFTILLYNAKLFLLVAIVLVPPVILIGSYTHRRLRNTRGNIKNNSEKSLQHLQEALSAYVESNIYDKNRFFIKRYSQFQRTLNKNLSDLQGIQVIPTRLIEVFAVLGLFVLILANTYMSSTSAGALINIGAFMAGAYRIIPSIIKVLNSAAQVKTYEYTLSDLLNEQPVDKPVFDEHAPHLKSLTFNNVSFHYHHNRILDRFNFSIKEGDFVGISGASGKGKTTFVNLLLGFLNPDSGSIWMNDAPADIHGRQHFWSHIAYVKQQPFFINDSILNNITLEDSDYNEIRLLEVVNASGLHDLIHKYPEGIDKIITENGKNISGGQRQRIAIARALYKQTDLIILDEPFSELDYATEQGFLEHFRKLSQEGKMVILITHNKSSLDYCNKIIKLND